jgi:hypothetical protein
MHINVNYVIAITIENSYLSQKLAYYVQECTEWSVILTVPMSGIVNIQRK